MSGNFFYERRAIPTTLLDVGSYADGGLRALAIGIVDNVLTKSIINPTLLAMLVEGYSPSDKAPAKLSKPVERLQKMLASPRGMTAFVNDLVSILEKTGNGNIHTLANTLGIPVEIKVANSGKQLFKRLHYGPSCKNSVGKVVIQLQDGHYLPRVSASAYFEHYVLHSAKSESGTSHNPHRFQEPASSLSNEVKKNLRRLSMMLDDSKLGKNGEKSKKILLDIYIKGINRQQQLVKNSSLEYGNQDFFEKMENKRPGIPVAGDKPRGTYDEQLDKELLLAISRGISIGIYTWDEVSMQIEQAQSDYTQYHGLK